MTRTLKDWAAWFEEFKARHGLTPERIVELTGASTPRPAADAPPPPRPHTEPPEREPGEDDEP